jgi:hypothetical protein
LVEMNPLKRSLRPTVSVEGGIGTASTFQDWNKENPPKARNDLATAHHAGPDEGYEPPGEPAAAPRKRDGNGHTQQRDKMEALADVGAKTRDRHAGAQFKVCYFGGKRLT